MYQRLTAKLEFFTTSLSIDMEKYQEQRAAGIGTGTQDRIQCILVCVIVVNDNIDYIECDHQHAYVTSARGVVVLFWGEVIMSDISVFLL